MVICAAAGDDAATEALPLSMARRKASAADAGAERPGWHRQRFEGAAAPLGRGNRLSTTASRSSTARVPTGLVGRAELAPLVAIAEDAGQRARADRPPPRRSAPHASAPEVVARIEPRQADPSRAETSGQEKGSPIRSVRADMFVAIEAHAVPTSRSARRGPSSTMRACNGMAMQAARLLAPALEGLWPSPSTAIPAEPVVEIALVVGRRRGGPARPRMSAAWQHRPASSTSPIRAALVQ